MKRTFEVNFDGLVGQTHQYGGLSYGNIPSESNRYAPSNPKKAALQGLKKMKFVADLGVKQALLPPHERPHLPTLRNVGFSGSDAQVIRSAFEIAPIIFEAVCSSSAMWTANAATVSPSCDSGDGKVHFTTANLSSHFHRSIEADMTEKLLKTIFNNPRYFDHHKCLPKGGYFTDEGAANHSRLCHSHAESGIQLFVYGRPISPKQGLSPKKYPARQTLAASNAIARLHSLDPQRILFVQMHPEAIDAGAFHHDLVATSNEQLLLFHERAYLGKEAFLIELLRKAKDLPALNLKIIEVKENEIPLKEALKSYFFNAQLLTIPEKGMQLIAPMECQQNPYACAYLDQLKNGYQGQSLIKEVHYIDLKQSMRNGGGPACLRLRVVLNEEELEATLPSIFLTHELYLKLVAWVEKHYREQLLASDIADPALLREVHIALDELTQLLHLGPIYDFQR